MTSSPWPMGSLLLCACLLSGCAAATSDTAACSVSFHVAVSPAAATVSSAVSSPGNQVQFKGIAVASAPAGCAAPALARQEYAAWANPDPNDVQISSANDGTNGTAVCLHATSAPVTLTGVFAPITPMGPAGSGSDTEMKTVSLSCQ